MEHATSMPAKRQVAYWMAHALIIETVGEPSHAHVMATLRDTNYRARLLLQCSNPDIRAFWCDTPSDTQASSEQTP